MAFDRIIVSILAPLAGLCALPQLAAARSPGPDAYMVRVLSCEGPDARMEIYLPQSVIFGTDAARARALTRPVGGLYTLDLTAAGKGKVLEPVRVRLSRDGKSVVVDQYTRGLPPTRVPLDGGTVDFDQRFGTQAKCGKFLERED